MMYKKTTPTDAADMMHSNPHFTVGAFVCMHHLRLQIVPHKQNKIDAGVMRHLKHLCFPLKTDASEFLYEIMNA